MGFGREMETKEFAAQPATRERKVNQPQIRDYFRLRLIAP